MEAHFAKKDTMDYFNTVASKLVKDAYKLYRQDGEAFSSSKVRQQNQPQPDASFEEQLLFVLLTWNRKFNADIIVEEV